MDPLLTALNEADFQWTTHIDGIWRDPSTDIPELQTTARKQLDARLSLLERSAEMSSPLGVPLLGTGGSGKTHVLSAVRRRAFERGHYFVLVDMTDVRDFWETVLLGYLRSLDQQDKGEPQSSRLLKRLVQKLGPGIPSFEELSRTRPPGLINRCNALIRGLSQKYRAEAREHQDVLRALALLSSDDFDIQDCGYQWLQGTGIAENDGFLHDFMTTQKRPEQIVRGLSWLMSLDAPTVLALDQLDAIVAEHNLASAAGKDAELSPRQLASLAIIQGIAGGLSALRDVTRRTLIVVSSLEATWNVLGGPHIPVTMKDRFEPSVLLQPIRDPASIRQLVEKRLAHAYTKHSVQPRYASYPFASKFFEERIGQLPREVLKACNEHRHVCAAAGHIVEVGADGTAPTRPDLHEVRREFELLLARAKVTALIEDEDALDKLIEVACDALVEENPLPSLFDAIIDRDFVGSGSFEPLHARVRVVDHAENDRELHYAFRFLEKTQHIAFQSRLKAAMTAAGIAPDLEFRRLAVIRTRPLPRSPMSERLIAELAHRRGRVLVPEEGELKVLLALKELLGGDSRRSALAREWLRSERPVSKLAVFQDAVAFLFNPAKSASATSNRPANGSAKPVAIASPTPPVPPVAIASPTPLPPRVAVAPPIPASARVWPTEIVLGQKLVAGSAAGAFSVPVDNLTKHAVVLAGAGSGKTVLVRRIVEEAALAGIPSIVIDGANDLSRLGDAWPQAPEAFNERDREHAARYFGEAEVIVWSPGRERGNPLRFDPLPDFAAALGDTDEFNAALDMARSSLEPIAIGTKVDKVRQGVLGAALRFFGSQGGGSIERLIAVLSELPTEANTGYEKGEKLAREAADRLRAETETNPLFRGEGTSLDPATLFRSRAPGKVRVSVINLSGLPDAGAQQQFINQLAMTLFSWIKKNPARGRALQGLLVIDEARDFVPSGKSVPGKDNIIRLVAQARKYGLGIVFATQAPKSIDHNVIANCSTQFYGRQNSPAAIETVQDQLTQRGASGSDVAKLPRGVFYAYTEGLSSAVKVQTPLCLSYHPSSPPDENEVLQRADASRALV